MIHTVHLDDKNSKVERLSEEIHGRKDGARFENPVSNNAVPEGYMTVEQFRTEAKDSLTKIMNKHGIH